MARKVDSLLRGQQLWPACENFETACWQPAADVYRTQSGWLVKFDLAGVAPDQIEVALCGNRLTVRGERRDCTIAECQRSYSMEICYSRFQRTIELPEPLDPKRLSTDYRDGMLLVRLMNA